MRLTRISFRIVVAVALAFLLTGCAKLDYLAQAGAGQYEIIVRSRDADELVREKHLVPRVRRLVSRVPEIKHFGEAHGLRATSNYTKYANLNRDAVVWVVSACDPLRFQSRTWNFPITGSITFLGYFHEADAQREGEKYARMGYDTDVRGASAYSTLGWLHDPLLSTMIYPGDEALGELADVVLHESTHATFYVPGQSRLNESVAEFSGEGLGALYMYESQGADSKETRAYLAAEARSEARANEMHEAYDALKAIYDSKAPREEKLREKQIVIDALQKKTRLKRAITNATLVQYATYRSGRAELASLLAACGNDWPRFLRRMAALEHMKLPAEQAEDVGAIVKLLGNRCDDDATPR